jgi:RNA polymerase sigma factor (sigma-70 family)
MSRGALPREAELFKRHGDELVRIVRGAIAAPWQIVEDACSFAWLELLRLQPERGAIVGWLRVVATNEVLRLLKGQARYAEFDEDDAKSAPSHADNGTDLQLALEARQALEQTAALTPQQVRIFSLHVAGLTYDEICAATGYSPRQVDRHMGRPGLACGRRGGDPTAPTTRARPPEGRRDGTYNGSAQEVREQLERAAEALARACALWTDWGLLEDGSCS